MVLDMWMKRLRAASGTTTRPRIGMLLPLAGLVLFSVLLTACGSTPTEAFSGTKFNKIEPAFDFQLQDQFGDPVSLSEQKDKVVVLTFLYTNCPDVCPIVTTQLKETFLGLSDVQEDVEFIAVSVDPERDTTSEAHDFLAKWNLENDWSYLVGTQEQLEPIWKAYFVDPAIDDTTPLQTGDSSAPTPHPTGALDSLSEQISRTYWVTHTAPVFLIDRRGQRRVVFTSPLDPNAVAHDIRILLDD